MKYFVVSQCKKKKKKKVSYDFIIDHSLNHLISEETKYFVR